MRNSLRILTSLIAALVVGAPLASAQTTETQTEPYHAECAPDSYCPPPECSPDGWCPPPTAECSPDSYCPPPECSPDSPSPAYPHDGPNGGYSEECMAYDDERRQASDRLHEEFRLRWDELDQKRRAYYSGGNHTPEEDQAFEYEMRNHESQLRNEMDQAFRALDEQYGQQEQQCHAQMAHGGQPMDPQCERNEMERTFRDFEDRLREQDERFFQLHEEKWRKFDQREREEYDRFTSGNHSQEEWAAFEQQRHDERRAFEERQHQELDAFHRNQEAQREQFRMEQESRCMRGAGGPGPDAHHRPPPGGMQRDFDRRGPGGPQGHRGPGPHGFDAAHEEMEIQRLECQLEVRKKMGDAMRRMDEMYRKYEESGQYPSHSEMEEMEIERLQTEIEVRKAMLACEKLIRDAWYSQVRTEIEGARPHERLGSWSMSEDEETGEVHLRGKFVTIKGDANTNTLKEVSVTGQLWIEGIATDSYFDEEDWNMGEGGQGSWLTGAGPGVHMRIHDNPSGLIRFSAEDGHSFLLTVPDFVTVEATQNGFALTSNGDAALLRAHHDQASWDASTGILTVSGKAEFLVPESAKNYVLDKVANKHRDEIIGAFEDRQLGGEITFTTDDEGEIVEETLVYDDVEVTIEEPEDDNTVSVIVSSDTLEDGKTFVLNLDEQIASVSGTLDVRYFDIDDGTGEETEVAIRKASSLSDVLDATDDDGPEYWIVMDEDGFQVLASVPHWSTHKIVVESLEAAGSEWPVPAPGFGLVGLTAVLAAVYVALRRRD